MQSDMFPNPPIIHMMLFAHFFATPEPNRPKIVKKLREQHGMSRTDKEKLFYYVPLTNTLRRTHWSTHRIETFEDAIPPLLEKISDKRKRERYSDVTRDYVGFWKERDATFVPVEHCDIKVSDLTIRVKPEIGMRVGTDTQILKLWLNGTEPTQKKRQIISYLMQRTSDEDPSWPVNWPTGILDISRRNILQPLWPDTDNFDMAIRGAVSSFVSMWRDFEEQARRDAESLEP